MRSGSGGKVSEGEDQCRGKNRIVEEERNLVFIPYGLFPEELGDGWLAMWPCAASKITLVN
jgi:hypothetical protein